MNKINFDELFEAKLKTAGYRLLEKIAQEAPTKEELSKFDVPTDKLDKKIKAAIRKEVIKQRAVKALKAVSTAAAAVIIIIGISAITITNSEALRIKFNDLFVSDNNELTEITAPNTVSESSLPKGSDFIKPGFIPEGFDLIEVDITANMVSNLYLNMDNSNLRIVRNTQVGTVTFNNDQSTHYETEIKGNRVIVVEYNNQNVVYYFSNNYFYNIIGEDIESEVMLKIAKNLPK